MIVTLIVFIKLILSFCSIVYELLLAQALSAFLENTVLRYSVTIGLYLFSMGMGALICEGRHVKQPVISLLKIEIALSVIGGFCIVLLHCCGIFDFSRMGFMIVGHGLIILIGILTGFELPLMLEFAQIKRLKWENTILGLDYFGAFLGTLFFAFLFYPKMGLVHTAFFIALLNSIAGVFLFFQKDEVESSCKKYFSYLLLIQVFIAIVLFICFLYASNINDSLVRNYLGG